MLDINLFNNISGINKIVGHLGRMVNSCIITLWTITCKFTAPACILVSIMASLNLLFSHLPFFIHLFPILSSLICFISYAHQPPPTPSFPLFPPPIPPPLHHLHFPTSSTSSYSPPPSLSPPLPSSTAISSSSSYSSSTTISLSLPRLLLLHHNFILFLPFPQLLSFLPFLFHFSSNSYSFISSYPST